MDKIFSNAEKIGDCLIWKGCKTPDGYPRITRNGNNNIRGHRYLYSQIHGEIQSNLVIRHTCDNRLCINPDHLVIGTILDNVFDRVDRKRGHINISDSQIEQIKTLRSTTALSQKDVGSIVGCSQMYISKLERNLIKRINR